MTDKEKDPIRNRPADKGSNEDPDVRDRSGLKPGSSTISDSKSDESDEHLTETASDNFRTEKFGENADTSFDEVDED